MTKPSKNPAKQSPKTQDLEVFSLKLEDLDTRLICTLGSKLE